MGTAQIAMVTSTAQLVLIMIVKWNAQTEIQCESILSDYPQVFLHHKGRLFSLQYAALDCISIYGLDRQPLW